MSWVRFGRVAFVTALALVASGWVGGGGPVGKRGTGQWRASGAGDCIAHHPNSDAQYPIWYAAGCSGHDEPELDPVSVAPRVGAGSHLDCGAACRWHRSGVRGRPHVLVGRHGHRPQSTGTVSARPSWRCSSTPMPSSTTALRPAASTLTYAPDKFSVCTPVWQVGSKSNAETAAFNAELYDGSSSKPLVTERGGHHKNPLLRRLRDRGLEYQGQPT